MAKALFCNETFIKENSPENFNCTTKTITNSINTMQDIYLTDIIGSGLVTQIEQQISGSSLSILNTTLLNDYIRPCLLWYVLSDLVGNILINDAGAGKQSTENIEGLTFQERKIKKDEYLNKAEFYANKITEYLIANSSSYPLFFAPGSSFDTVFPEFQNFHSGMYFPDSNGEMNVYERKAFLPTRKND
jgi:hypothetical protein